MTVNETPSILLEVPNAADSDGSLALDPDFIIISDSEDPNL